MALITEGSPARAEGRRRSSCDHGGTREDSRFFDLGCSRDTAATDFFMIMGFQPIMALTCTDAAILGRFARGRTIVVVLPSRVTPVRARPWPAEPLQDRRRPIAAPMLRPRPGRVVVVVPKIPVLPGADQLRAPGAAHQPGGHAGRERFAHLAMILSVAGGRVLDLAVPVPCHVGTVACWWEHMVGAVDGADRTEARGTDPILRLCRHAPGAQWVRARG